MPHPLILGWVSVKTPIGGDGGGKLRAITLVASIFWNQTSSWNPVLWKAQVLSPLLCALQSKPPTITHGWLIPDLGAGPHPLS